LGELLDGEAVLRQQPGVVDADAERQEAAELAAVRRLEADVAERLRDCRLALLGGQRQRGQVLGELGAVALGEVDDDRRVCGPLCQRRRLISQGVSRKLNSRAGGALRRGHLGDADAVAAP
jgi:hypothetical protein